MMQKYERLTIGEWQMDWILLKSYIFKASH